MSESTPTPQGPIQEQHTPSDTNVDPEPASKRIKLDNEQTDVRSDGGQQVNKVEDSEQKPVENKSESVLPPSRVLLGHLKSETSLSRHTEEVDVGISEYLSRDLPPIHAIIKQRYTDFLVYEVDLDGKVVNIKSLARPSSDLKKHKELQAVGSTTVVDPSTSTTESLSVEPDQAPSEATDLLTNNSVTLQQNEDVAEESDELWHDRFESTLKEYLTDGVITQVKQLYLEGPEPPFVPDAGWEGRKTKQDNVVSAQSEAMDVDEGNVKGGKSKRGGGRGRGRDRGRGGRGGKVDNRKVVTDQISSKTVRTGLHSAIKELFRGKLDTETDSSAPSGDGGPRIAIRWARQGGGRGGRSGGGRRGNAEPASSRGNYPPYIHFTLQKTNRDTQDALSHLSRMLHVTVRDLSVAGTKDKRAVTTQRVSLKRNGKSVEDVWDLANGQKGRKSLEEALTQRGERGVRIADLNYRKSSLELGMLKGNVFVITLRNVQVDSVDILNKAMESMKTKGFINYYGMQRFGTATVPTHSIGLALLQSDWQKAVSLLLQHRPGEHPDVVAARDAWLKEGDLDKALSLLPRRVVAERCILESFKKMNGDTRNAMGALSTIPRNLRLMYVHAYQSYVWNAIVSERIRLFGADKPVPGDLVYESEPDEEAVEETSPEKGDTADLEEEVTEGSSKRSRKPWQAPKVKTLTEADVDKYTIFDVIMPLPGKDVAYPGGPLGDRYREFLKLDGLDPDNLVRKQKDYSLSGSYRKILHLPKNLSWSILRYTDPEVPLAQADEDKLLGFDAPVVDENGKFVALQVNMQLGTAAYATMALREVTKTETSSHYQTSLTMSSEDQMFRGTGGNKESEMEV